MMRNMIFAAMLAFAAPVTAQSAAPDPRAIELAQRIAAAQLPDGTYKQMMGPVTDQLSGQVMNQLSQMPLRDLMRMGGLSEAQLARVGPATMQEVMAVMDPAFTERTGIMMRTMMDGMMPLMTSMEPALRRGVAEAMARRFSVAELEQIAAFYATPAGAKLAAQAMLIYTDPAVMQASADLMPQLTRALPDIMQRAQAATAHLPKPRDPEQLTPAERDRLAKLLGVDPATLRRKPAS